MTSQKPIEIKNSLVLCSNVQKMLCFVVELNTACTIHLFAVTVLYTDLVTMNPRDEGSLILRVFFALVLFYRIVTQRPYTNLRRTVARKYKCPG